ncbi:MAG: hypothetical protein CBD51_006555 [Flavobacteriales bacterium TMED191]|nr:MAG: hypothetical protein CBD51_006555 [Flavobacteriales bacterium TMED191]
MKIEGKYIDDEGNEQFYNNHTGPTNGVDLSFEQPIFNFSEDGFTNVASSIYISMNVNNFYNNPIYDFNTFGSSIMANIEAQYNLNQNVGDVFTIQVN